jgi:ABC-type Fe3+-siderophore transport system permease subunit
LSSAGALLGVIVVFVRRNVYAVPLAAFPVVFPVLYYVTHTSLRYRHPIDPVVMLLAALAISSVWGGHERHAPMKNTQQIS